MAFQPLTYAGQYPPLQPRSPSDIASFDLLHTSLRQLPELTREGDKILNEEMLSKLVDGVRRFQRDHLGRKSKSKYWPTIRLPDILFSDRSSYPGPLGTAILSAFRIKQISSWRNFNFDNPKLFDDNISIIKKMEGDLMDRGYLKRPVLYFDTTVEEGLGKGEVARLTKIAVRFGATVVDDVKEVSNGRVTHVVAYDPEEHDTKEVMEEEERRDKGGEDTEKTYLKTLAVVDMPIIADGNSNGNDAAMKKKMALVHWWYHPSSYDEWMPAEDVSGDIESEEHPGIPGGPAVVGCKFVRDVEKFNEWGVESDYAVMEYKRKIAYLRQETSAKKTSNISNTSSSKKSSKNKRSSTAKTEPSVLETLETLDQIEPAAKKKKVQKDESASALLPSPAASPKKAKSKSSSQSTKTNIAALHPTQRQASERRAGSGGAGGGGMNPRRILTGMRGLRNEVIRRTVYDGALRVEDESYRLVRDALTDYLLGSDAAAAAAVMDGLDGGKVLPPTLNARPEWRKLLPPTGFIRPSVDTSLKYMTVTELTLPDEEPPAAPVAQETNVNATGAPPMPTTASATTVAVHQSIPILISVEVEAAGKEAIGEEPLSMRGGGLEEEPPAQEEEQQQHQEGIIDSNLSTNPDESNEVAVVQPPAIAESNVPPDTATEDGGHTETVPDSQVAVSAGTPSPVENIQPEQAESKQDAMQVDEMTPMAPVESVQQEEIKESPSEHSEEPSEKPPEGEAMASGDGIEIAPSAGVEGAPTDTLQDTNSMAVDSPAEDTKPTVEDLPAEDTKPMAVDSPAEDTKPMEEDSPAEDTKPMAEDSPAEGDDNAAPAEHAPEAAATQGHVDDNTNTASDVAIKPTSEAATASTTAATTAAATADAQVTSSTAPTAAVRVSSSASVTRTAEATTADLSTKQPAVCQVVSLPLGTQLSTSLYRPSTAAAAASPAEEAKDEALARPSWYQPTKPSEFEKRTLSEWFNSTAPHRTSTSYISTREKILDLAKRNGHQYITSTAIRRSVAGDAGSLLRLHIFLMDWGLLNGEQIGETAPSDAVLRGLHAAGGVLVGAKRKYSQVERSLVWSTDRMHSLETSIVHHASNKTDEGTAPSSMDASTNQVKLVIDWNAVAADVGGGVTAADCQRAFINPPTEAAKMTADAASNSGNKVMFSEILDGVSPEVLNATIEASFQSTNDITEARKASFVAAVAGAAAQKGEQTEVEIENTLMDIIDQRFQRLENRVALLDDVEALLEAERVALELERRDMYTTRCRHWFGDGSS
mmetsp:Transcript_16323/g.35271  ORF Transcript_16323/g.35271 Transcript_16323/m.35271 type:complete len:1272 (-) Transcript_16323:77-3892(-)